MSTLSRKYKGKYIAVFRGNIVGYDKDKGRLAMKVYKKYGYIISLNEAKKFAPYAKIGGEYKLPEKYFKLIRNEK